jgi:hypothetical protein
MNPRIATLLFIPLAGASLLSGQTGTSGQTAIRRTCPGDPAGNLASVDCSFTLTLRFQNLVTSSISDQAMLGSVFYGTIAHVMNDPHEWGRGWAGFGDRVGSRYGQNLGKGIVEFSFGAALKIDPRHVSYASDPLIQPAAAGQGCVGAPAPGTVVPATVRRRIGHAFMDFLTVRRSSEDGCGHRLPNIPLFAGSAAGAFVGDLWYPPSARTPEEIGLRAAGSLATALGSSFYTEFSPELGRVLGAIFKTGKTPTSPPAPPPPPPNPNPGPAARGSN